MTAAKLTREQIEFFAETGQMPNDSTGEPAKKFRRKLCDMALSVPEARAAALEEAARVCETLYQVANHPQFDQSSELAGEAEARKGEAQRCATAIRALASNDAVPRTLSEFVHAPQALKEKIGMEVVDAAIARQTLSSTTSPQPVSEACRKEGWVKVSGYEEAEKLFGRDGTAVHDSSFVFRSINDQLYAMPLPAAPASDGEGGV